MVAGTPSPSADGRSRSLADPFETLGLAPAFALDSGLLEQRHRELSRALHPDRYAGRPASERQQALGRAIEVNAAFRTLRDPVQRAEALLARSGHAASETDGARPDPGFLMDVMEQREALGDARRKRDLPAVRALGAGVRAREARVTAELGLLFSAEKPEYARISALLGELRYHRRFLDEAGAIEDDLDEVSS